MAWNEPGGNQKKDPWSGKGGQEPPDLDEVLRQMKNKFGRFFGGGSGSSGGNGSNGGPSSFSINGSVVAIVIAILVALWASTGFYVVDQGKKAIVLTLGKYSETTLSGLHWRIPYPIQTAELVDVERLRFQEVGYVSQGQQKSKQAVSEEAIMLTKDENIVDIQLAVTYKVNSPKNYLFNVRDPEDTLKQATESAIREIVGKYSMDEILTERSKVADETKILLQEILSIYNTGLLVSAVNLQDAQPPEEVQDAFIDAIKAREDEDRQRKEAQAYSNEIIPKARGAAARLRQEAEGYKEQVIAQSDGETNRFLKLLEAYEKAPEVTRNRLYIESMESVLEHTNKVFIDVNNGGNLFYLPLDKMMNQQNTSAPALPLSNASENPIVQDTIKRGYRTRDNLRGRRPR